PAVPKSDRGPPAADGQAAGDQHPPAVAQGPQVRVGGPVASGRPGRELSGSSGALTLNTDLGPRAGGRACEGGNLARVVRHADASSGKRIHVLSNMRSPTAAFGGGRVLL